MNYTDLKDKKVTVMGLGLHGGGVATARWLARQGAKVTVTDLKTKQELKKSLDELSGLDIDFVLDKHRKKDFKNIDLVVKNPGVPRESEFLQIAEQAGVEITTDINIFFSLCPAPVIGITGTKGKSTTTVLVGEILKLWKKDTIVAGNIRKSPLDFLHKITKNTPVVLELSSWQLEGLPLIKQSPHIAVVTNIYRDHMNRYGSLDDYMEAKKLIYTFQTPDDFAVFNYDNEHTAEMGREVFSQRYWFSKKYFAEQNGVFVTDDKIVLREAGKEKEILKIKDIILKGEHNLENILAAVAVCLIKKVPLKFIRQGVKSFKGLQGRLQLITTSKDIDFINDTTATAPQAVISSLNSLKEKYGKNIILLAGGADKKLDFQSMAKEIKKSCKKVILFSGEASKKIKKELSAINYPASNIVYPVNDMREAMKKSLAFSVKGDVVLLSPGAASFGLFVNEFDRGEKFVKAVKDLT